MMRFDFAPMEGITGYIYRNAHCTWFGGIDRYVSPFLSPSVNKGFCSREEQDICREHNEKLTLIPQILTNQADVFLRAAEILEDMGYQEINLNLGCPSGTVVSKKKGSGFLAYPEELEIFLTEIFSKSPIAISIKTRIGKESPDEFSRLLPLFNQFPIKELTIHPRIQKDMYKNTPNWEVFAEALKESINPVCYNGDITTIQDYQKLIQTFPELKAVMIGRGLLRNPALALEIRHAGEGAGDGKRLSEDIRNIKNIREIQGIRDTRLDATETKKLEAIWGFHNQVYREYQKVLFGDRNVLFKMKEIWFYLAESFPNCEKEMKKIKKAEKSLDYERAVDAVFSKKEVSKT